MSGELDARVRLEGAAELLEATRIRYRLLLRQLSSVWWQQRLRTTAEVLREVARVQAQVEQAIAAASRHAERDAWPRGSALRACLDEVRGQVAQLEQLATKRLGDAAKGLSLAAQLTQLEHEVLTAPRVVLPGQRWASALQVLPWPSPELTLVAAFGERLEAVFARLIDDGGAFAVSFEALEAVATTWAAGVTALAAVWARLESIDRSGVLVRYLRSRARRTPIRSRTTGPDVLLHAEFWRAMAMSRVEATLATRVGPVVCSETERFAVLQWAWQVEHEVPATLKVMPAARAALIELASAVNRLPANRQWATAWPRVLELAASADAKRGDADWQRMHDSLALLARVLETAGPKAVPPAYRTAQTPSAGPVRRETPDSLAGLLRTMQR